MHTNPPGQPAARRRRDIVRGLIVFLSLLSVTLILVWYSLQPQPNRNALALGERASLAAAEPVAVEIQKPGELNFKTRQQVLDLRQAAALSYPFLLAGAYRPADSVFQQIEDGRPWWGTAGEFYYGPGQHSIDGPAEETRFLLNPYLLVGAEFYGLSIWADSSLWDTARITPQDLARDDFPFFCPPQDLLWWPRQGRAEVTYDLSLYLQRLNAWTSRPFTEKDALFGLTAYNARDLNLNYLQVAAGESANIRLPRPFDQPVAGPEFLHRGGSCQYPGGCNNASPDVPQFDDFSIQALPARLVIHLWKDAPLSAQQPADFIFILLIK